MERDNDVESRAAAAREWRAKVVPDEAGSDAPAAFAAWRHDHPNHSDPGAPGGETPAVDRYVVRPQAGRFRVVDIWTGEAAVVAMTAQDGLSVEDAQHMAVLLNRRVAAKDRAVVD